ncbi:unnamed protein product [Amoebophrya sp. A25]|nr:unnamed protein product [Amoebophrya sp. A25]|eukprot:GSA25T00000138001.1
MTSTRSASPAVSRKFSLRSDSLFPLSKEATSSPAPSSTPPMLSPERAEGEADEAKLQAVEGGGEDEEELQIRTGKGGNKASPERRRSSTARGRSMVGKADIQRRTIAVRSVAERQKHREKTREAIRTYRKHRDIAAKDTGEGDLLALAALHQNHVHRAKINSKGEGVAAGASPSSPSGTSGKDVSPGSKARRLILLESVDLSKMGLYTLQHLEFRNVRTLRLTHNQLRELPVLDLPTLQKLDLSKNQLTTTRNLFLCEHLEELVFDQNRIRCVQNLETLESLKFLDLRNNQIEDATALRSIAYNVSLVVLLLQGNSVTTKTHDKTRHWISAVATSKNASRGLRYWSIIANFAGENLLWVDDQKLFRAKNAAVVGYGTGMRHHWIRPMFFELEAGSRDGVGDACKSGSDAHPGWSKGAREAQTTGTQVRVFVTPKRAKDGLLKKGVRKRKPGKAYGARHADPVIDGENARLQGILGQTKDNPFGGPHSKVKKYRNMKPAERQAYVRKLFRGKRGLSQFHLDREKMANYKCLGRPSTNTTSSRGVLYMGHENAELLRDWMESLRQKSVVEHHTTAYEYHNTFETPRGGDTDERGADGRSKQDGYAANYTSPVQVSLDDMELDDSLAYLTYKTTADPTVRVFSLEHGGTVTSPEPLTFRVVGDVARTLEARKKQLRAFDQLVNACTPAADTARTRQTGYDGVWSDDSDEVSVAGRNRSPRGTRRQVFAKSASSAKATNRTIARSAAADGHQAPRALVEKAEGVASREVDPHLVFQHFFGRVPGAVEQEGATTRRDQPATSATIAPPHASKGARHDMTNILQHVGARGAALSLSGQKKGNGAINAGPEPEAGPIEVPSTTTSTFLKHERKAAPASVVVLPRQSEMDTPRVHLHEPAAVEERPGEEDVNDSDTPHMALPAVVSDDGSAGDFPDGGDDANSNSNVKKFSQEGRHQEAATSITSNKNKSENTGITSTLESKESRSVPVPSAVEVHLASSSGGKVTKTVSVTSDSTSQYGQENEKAVHFGEFADGGEGSENGEGSQDEEEDDMRAMLHRYASRTTAEARETHRATAAHSPSTSENQKSGDRDEEKQSADFPSALRRWKEHDNDASFSSTAGKKNVNEYVDHADREEEKSSASARPPQKMAKKQSGRTRKPESSRDEESDLSNDNYPSAPHFASNSARNLFYNDNDRKRKDDDLHVFPVALDGPKIFRPPEEQEDRPEDTDMEKKTIAWKKNDSKTARSTSKSSSSSLLEQSQVEEEWSIPASDAAIVSTSKVGRKEDLQLPPRFIVTPALAHSESPQFALYNPPTRSACSSSNKTHQHDKENYCYVQPVRATTSEDQHASKQSRVTGSSKATSSQSEAHAFGRSRSSKLTSKASTTQSQMSRNHSDMKSSSMEQQVQAGSRVGLLAEKRSRMAKSRGQGKKSLSSSLSSTSTRDNRNHLAVAAEVRTPASGEHLGGGKSKSPAPGLLFYDEAWVPSSEEQSKATASACQTYPEQEDHDAMDVLFSSASSIASQPRAQGNKPSPISSYQHNAGASFSSISKQQVYSSSEQVPSSTSRQQKGADYQHTSISRTRSLKTSSKSSNYNYSNKAAQEQDFDAAELGGSSSSTSSRRRKSVKSSKEQVSSPGDEDALSSVSTDGWSSASLPGGAPSEERRSETAALLEQQRLIDEQLRDIKVDWKYDHPKSLSTPKSLSNPKPLSKTSTNQSQRGPPMDTLDSALDITKEKKMTGGVPRWKSNNFNTQSRGTSNHTSAVEACHFGAGVGRRVLREGNGTSAEPLSKISSKASTKKLSKDETREDEGEANKQLIQQMGYDEALDVNLHEEDTDFEGGAARGTAEGATSSGDGAAPFRTSANRSREILQEKMPKRMVVPTSRRAKARGRRGVIDTCHRVLSKNGSPGSAEEALPQRLQKVISGKAALLHEIEHLQ